MTPPPTGPDPGPSDEEERRVLAGEHVLGLLTPEESAWVERERARDARLDQAVQDWQERLLPLDRAVPPAEPDPGLWPRIAASVGAAAPTPARAPAGPGLLARLERAVWSSLGFWRATGLVATAAAVLIAVLTTLRPPAPVPVAVAVLVGRESQAPGWIVETFEGGRTRLVPLTTVDVPADRSLQVWTLKDPAQGPVSLGLLPRAQAPWSAGTLPPVDPGQLFEITLEPAAGSPTGRPTGPILFIGRAALPPGA
jgi:anti-sigma-K factor RskA